MNVTNYTVPGKKTTVPIHTGKGAFEDIKSVISSGKYSSVFLIVDENVHSHWNKKIHDTIGKESTGMVIPAGEKNKTLATVEKIWTGLSKINADRKSLVINIGGGMVCDIGAFAASTYMRGLSYIQVATTLLAQADAAIGGKTGFNFNGLKNTIGTFSAPVAVISDSSFLTTIPQREFRSGLAEIIKHALIEEGNLFEYLNNANFAALKEKELDNLLSLSTAIKCNIVTKDPYEKKERKKLNFGHTVGHAVEMASENKLLHGEAVAIGIIAEARMSFLSGSLSENKFREIENLISKAKLPNSVSPSYKPEILKKILADKKNVSKKIKWVFLEDIGMVKVDVNLPEDIVDEGVNYILK